MRILYGPIDSWRLGRSLGVDPLAARHKLCPFSCIYCQYGETPHPTLRRRAYVSVQGLRADLDVLGDVPADCVTFAGLGEPTLSANLPDLVAVMRERFSLPVVLLTGGALIPRRDVRRDLVSFDRVIVTLNAPNQVLFERINRPGPSYPHTHAAIVEGLCRFRRDYSGLLVMHVMFVQANRRFALQMAALVRRIQPDEVQLNTPLQPALGEPLSDREMSTAAQAFVGQPVRTVFDGGAAGTPSLKPRSF
jgi:wyosine [tRNA(Phe)-imidazoG37] synthetase (radical SAM superfamily)